MADVPLQPPDEERQRRALEAAKIQASRMKIIGTLALIGAGFIAAHALFWTVYAFHVAIKAW